MLDRKGHHARKCACGGDRVRCHNDARNLVGRFASAAGHNPTLEKPGLLQPSPDQPGAQRRRPADVFLPSWLEGRPAALDIAITSPQRLEIIQEASTRMGSAAAAYEAFKRAHLNTAEDCIAQGMAFIPMIAETSGGWGTSAICTLKALSRAAAARSDRSSGFILSEQLQLLGSAIRRAKARAVLRRDTGSENLVSSAFASAAAVLHEDAGSPAVET